MVGSCGEGVTQPRLEHVHHGLDLPALAVRFIVEVGGHEPTPLAFGQLVRGPPDLRGDHRFDSKILPQHLVVLFAVIARIQEELVGDDLAGHVFHQREELVDVGPGALPAHVAEDDVIFAVDDDAELGEAVVGDTPRLVFVVATFLALLTSFCEVGRAAVGRETSRVARRLIDACDPSDVVVIDGRVLRVAVELFEGLLEEFTQHHVVEQLRVALLEGGIVGHLVGQVEDVAQVRPLADERNGCAVVLLEELA